MKLSLIALFAIVALSFAQSPTPLPQVDLTKMEGLWYIAVAYPSNPVYGLFSCYTWNITVLSETSVQIDASVTVFGQVSTTVATVEVSENGAVWSNGDASTAWVALDSENGSWATFGSIGEEGAGIVSRTPSLSASVVQSQIALLQEQGYSINSSDIYLFNNAC